MLKKVMITVAVVLALAVMILGWTKTWSYLRGTQEVLNEKLDDNAPMELELARIKAMIKDNQREIRQREDDICGLEARRDSVREYIGNLHEKLAAEVELLKKIKSMLSEKREQYVIGSQTYTFAQVNDDALKGLAVVKELQADISFQQSLVNDLDKSVKQARSNLAQGYKKINELRAALEKMEVRNTNADLRLQVTEIINAVEGAPLNADTELEKAILNFEQRVRSKEYRAESRLSAGNGQDRIDYSETMTKDAASEIDKLLNEFQPQSSSAQDSKPVEGYDND